MAGNKEIKRVLKPLVVQAHWSILVVSICAGLAGHNDEIYTVSDFSMQSHVITGSKGGEYPSILHLSMPETGQ